MNLKYLLFFIFFISIISPAKSQVCISFDSAELIKDNLDGTCTFNVSIIINSANGATGFLTLSMGSLIVYTDESCVCNPSTVTFPVTADCDSGIVIDGTYDAPGNGNDCTGSTEKVALPIEWISTDITNHEGYNLISWTVIENSGNDKYIIERSQNGREYDQICVQKNEGSDNIISHYSFTDDEPVRGLNYYRIKQLDHDGSFSFSDILIIESESPERISVYPNPFNNTITIQGDFIDSWSISNIYGGIIKSGNEIQIDAFHFQPGIYYMQIVYGSETITKALIKR